MKLATRLVWAAATGLVGVALGDPQPEQPKTPAPAAPETKPADPMGGPRVNSHASSGIVEYDMAGKVVRLDVPPAEAALGKLKLDEATRKAADKVLLDRSAALDKFVQNNLLDLAATANAFQSGNKVEGLHLLNELRDKSPELNETAKLPQKLSAALPKEQGEKLRSMVGEYNQAIIKEETDAATAVGTKPKAPGLYAVAENLRVMGLELKAAYERVIGQQTKEFEETLKALNLSAAQESRIRGIVGDAFQANKGKYSAADKTKVFWKVWAELEPAQRQELARRMREEQGKK
jgi:hypothetical protein